MSAAAHVTVRVEAPTQELADAAVAHLAESAADSAKAIAEALDSDDATPSAFTITADAESDEYRAGWRQGMNQAIIELEAEAGLSERRIDSGPTAEILRAFANRLRKIRGT